MLSRQKKAENGKSGKIDTLIGGNSHITGDLNFSGGLHVDGKVTGRVLAQAEGGSVLSLSEQGTIEGEIRAPHIVLNGTIVGDVHASVHLELGPKARISGDVFYEMIEMARGAEVNGNMIHRVEQKEQPGGSSRATAQASSGKSESSSANAKGK